MKVRIKDIIYHIRWEYHLDFEAKDIACYITNAKTKKDIVICTVKLHHKDEYDKITGRKCALKKAIKGFNKEERAIFWRAYHKLREQIAAPPEVIEGIAELQKKLELTILNTPTGEKRNKLTEASTYLEMAKDGAREAEKIIPNKN